MMHFGAKQDLDFNQLMPSINFKRAQKKIYSMDFIKTSSLRALIELTFQRNWNGLIWMSRKGVIAKRVKTAPDGSIENQRPTRSPAGRGTNVPRSAKTVSVRLKSRPKSKPSADHATRPGKHCPAVGQAQRHATPRTTSARAGKQASRPRNFRVPRPMHPSEPGRTSHVRPRNHRPNLSADQPADHETIRPDRSDSAQDPTVRPIVPTDRPNAAVDPKPFLKPNPHNSSPKPAPT
ncbi:unnamed protein product [Microthlaspi erraticum]|uniref:Uncharacterized protein n=1 Tax=Microthlaspi erraticum TaxID=1685480 RepID=A0A6D2I0V9_9BRAS|nr:unnamed protein product [Microthlaspi erraticum]